MEIKVFHNNEKETAAFFDAIKYWSNALGELHHHGQYDITEEELPPQLKHAYNDLFFEGNVGCLRYLVETEKGFGIALINEYDDFTAENSKLSMDALFKTVVQDANVIAKDPLFAKAEVFVGEFTGFKECHELTVVFPADIPTEEFYLAAAKLDQLAYQTCFTKQKPSLAAQIQSADSRKTAKQTTEVLEYDNDIAKRCGSLDVDVVSPQDAANLFGKPVKAGDKTFSPKVTDTDISR